MEHAAPMSRPELVFVSPRFLFPAHSGGAIRTSQILRRMKGGRFRITLLSPCSEGDARTYREDLAAVADEFVGWHAASPENRARLQKAMHLFDRLPISVAADNACAARRAVAAALARRPAVVVADFVHSAVLLPARAPVASVLFTHNCEAEICERHAERADGRWMRWLWRDQARKMRAFEAEALRRFDAVVAVADRDAARFESDYGVRDVQTIPTGVDLDYFAWHPPDRTRRVVFTGSMDWLANSEGIEWMMSEVWPRVSATVPEAEMLVIGKAPPERLVARAARLRCWRFLGRVPDIRTLIEGADAYVIPLRIGGGTRIKAFEAMAAGVPVVSTSLGVEGLGVEAGEQFLCGDDAQTFADALIRLLNEHELGRALSERARAFVLRHCSNDAVAARFEEICAEAVETARRDGWTDSASAARPAEGCI